MQRKLSNKNFYFDHRINDEIGGQETKDKLCEHQGAAEDKTFGGGGRGVQKRDF